ncbi:DEAD/DEAH box helicase [Paenibacillus apis]|uniref:ATP-dependent helicase n=1 Tax=Paenibacillus apis TaxID=1792174 RepID=A0A919Y370_9BACL|nr:DEAD/DEAH box helicase [Paenibacillus apis]GIO44061.1 ATP-dependent helicase [Paenibacillus apis]
MNQRLYGIWLGEVMFCFSGEISEMKVDAWTAAIRPLEPVQGLRPFQHAALRLAEVRYPVYGGRKWSGAGERRGLIGRTLEGVALSVTETWQLLLNWDESYYKSKGIQPGGEFEYWSIAAQFARSLLAKGRIAPGIRAGANPLGRRRTNQSSAAAEWGPELKGDDLDRFHSLAASMPPIALAAVQSTAEEGSLEERQAAVLRSFLTAMIDRETRLAVGELGRKLNPARAGYSRGYSPLAELWWNHLLSASIPPDIQGSSAEIEQLTAEIERVQGKPRGPEGLEADYDDGLEPGSIRLCLRIEPLAEHGDELAEDRSLLRWRLSCWGEGVEDPAVLLPAGIIWSYPEPDMELRGRRYKGIQRSLLIRLAKAAEYSRELEELLMLPRPEALTLKPEDVYQFLRRSVAPLRKHGVTVQMPSRWTGEGRRSAGVKIKALNWKAAAASANGMEHGSWRESQGLGVQQLISFEIEALLDGEPLSREELAKLAASKSPLVWFRGEWIEIDSKELRQVLKLLKKQEQGEMSFREFMALAAGTESLLPEGLQVEHVEAEGMLAAFLEGGVLHASNPRPVPESLNGTLRPYQERGFQWLAAMRELGFGALLADDMGLGKTVQVITELLDGQRESSEPSLIICPTSLLGNWQREIVRFAPGLRLYIHHGGDRLHEEKFIKACRGSDIVLTTYQLAGRDAKDLRDMEWKTIVLDEAQYIKNFGTKQAQSVMKLQAPQRIAMTGTPVENRLSELWSIFQFLNPGYLGTHAAFRARYGSAADSQGGELEKLRKLVAPFLMRRLKSDPDIRKDLPEKIELKSYCSLTVEQAALYEAVTEELISSLDGMSGIARKGHVLSSLTRLKQICDHPQLVPSRGRAGGGRSGKLDRLYELLDLIMDNGEAALIFTQYVQMGELLKERLAERYGEAPGFLHGGMPRKERDELVEAFQKGTAAPIFVLSLKAGGVGLNLTRANHVIHYDRWWNPAVENQATDRVFRIGQQKNVEVHKLITQGTLEERIDELIERKKALSEQVVGAGEQWLTEMSDQELADLIMLQTGGYLEVDRK